MSNLPLHPLLVHFPIVLAVLVPLVVLVIMILIHKRALPAKSWWTVVAICGLLFVSSFAAMKQGERDEDRVEAFVTEQALEHHEALGERVTLVAGILFLLSLVPLAGKGVKSTQFLVLAGAILCLGVTFAAGHSGGELVYLHGAAGAFQQVGPDGQPVLPPVKGRGEEREDDEDED